MWYRVIYRELYTYVYELDYKPNKVNYKPFPRYEDYASFEELPLWLQEVIAVLDCMPMSTKDQGIGTRYVIDDSLSEDTEQSVVYRLPVRLMRGAHV